ncbi:ribonuclease [Mesorhizobium sp. IMUNJ 23232]|uniref:ribonuclease T2 family protein n=1 Tax=Mesorhizobium sp. IMUNJ 23232 TaxID=3376064 RepID=UPI0037AD1D10
MRCGRRSSRRLAAFLGVALLALAGCDQQPQSDSEAAQSAAVDVGKKIPLGKGFDFYVLSLSWSPSYCEAEGENANRQQCASGRPYAFVVHGLWPQFERGFPEDCGTGGQDVDNDTARSLYDLMPSAGLIRHEWRKHGTCSGLSQADYFKVLRFARERVVVPQEFRRLDDYRTLSPGEAEQSFLEANPGLDASQIAVSCDHRFLREVRICMTKDLRFRGCPEIDRRACRAAKVVMPPMRGG